MTDSSSLCSQLDAYIDGDLSDTDASVFEAHAENCSECAADLAAARILDAEWTRLSTVTAPLAVLNAALREAKRVPHDRAPVRGTRRPYGRLAGWVTVGVLAIALASAVLWMPPAEDPVPSQSVAMDLPARSDTEETPAETAVPEIADPIAEPRMDAPPKPSPAPSRTPRSASPSRRQPVPMTQQPETEPPPVQLAERSAVPPDSVVQAQQDLMLALSLVAHAQSRAGDAVSTEIGRAAGALTETSLF